MMYNVRKIVEFEKDCFATLAMTVDKREKVKNEKDCFATLAMTVGKREKVINGKLEDWNNGKIEQKI